MKLSHQFGSGETGGKRISDQVGAGSSYWDEKAKALIPKSVRQRAQVSVADMLVAKKQGNGSLSDSAKDLQASAEIVDERTDIKISPPRRGIFDGLVIYVNGSTHPLISDHKLKHVLTENGARMSIHLGRRQVTHVIVGRPCRTENFAGIDGARPGAGGGLAATKIQKEIKRIGGCAVKYVGVEWVLESLKAQKRLPESQFGFKLALSGQQSVDILFKKRPGA